MRPGDHRGRARGRARLADGLGGDYDYHGDGFRPSAGLGAREVAISAGRTTGWGVQAILDAPYSLTLTDPGATTRAWMVVVERDWTTSPLVTAMRFDGSLYFANVTYFEDMVLKAVADHKDAKFLLVVADAINSMDSSGEEMLQNLVGQLRETGVQMVFSGLKKQVLDVMRATGLYERIGEENIHATECQALKAIFARLGQDVRDDALFAQVKVMVC